MELNRIFCPQCEGEVRTTQLPVPGHSTHSSVSGEGDLVCLDFGEGCRHSGCPLSNVSGVVMAIRLARSGLADETFEHIHAHCEGCLKPTDMKVISKGLAICEECETTNRWVRLKADGGFIILTGVEVTD